MKTASLLILTMAAMTARADFSYTTTTKSPGGPIGGAAGANQTTRHSLKGQKMKVDMGATASIIDFDAQTITSINSNQKTYSVMKFSDLEQMMKQSNVEATVDVRETGQHREINGYNATEVVMTMAMDTPMSQGGMKMQMEMDMWLSPDVPGSKELRTFYERNGSRFPWAALGAGANPSMQKAIAEMQRKMASIGGVPVLQTMKMKAAGNEAQMAQMQQGMAAARARLEEMKRQGGQQAAAAEQALARMGAMGGSGSGTMFEMNIESSNFSTASIPDSVFAIPAGYTQTDRK